MNTNSKRRVTKQYNSLADALADKAKQRDAARRSRHHSVSASNANVKDLTPEEFAAKYSKRRRTGKTARERASGEANQRYQNRVNRAKYNHASLTSKDAIAGRDEASRLFSEYCGSCNGKKTRAIRAAAA